MGHCHRGCALSFRLCSRWQQQWFSLSRQLSVPGTFSFCSLFRSSTRVTSHIKSPRRRRGAEHTVRVTSQRRLLLSRFFFVSKASFNVWSRSSDFNDDKESRGAFHWWVETSSPAMKIKT